MYAIGGSGNPTINSQGNRYIAPSDPSAKEVKFVNFDFDVFLITHIDKSFLFFVIFK